MARVSIRLDPAREEAELREYLGERFELERLWHYAEQLDAEFADAGDEAQFYRSSIGYLYNLTAFAMTGTKVPYLEELVRRLPPPARVLDYGCGIGSDGLLLLELGYVVEFADFANPSTEYLGWRLRHRGLQAPIHDLDKGVPAGFDAAFAFDVIEHVPDAFGFLHELEMRAELVEVNFLEPVADDTELHHELPIGELLDHCASHRLRSYSVLYGRSHLILYSSAPAGSAVRQVNRMRIAGRRLLRTAQRHAPSSR